MAFQLTVALAVFGAGIVGGGVVFPTGTVAGGGGGGGGVEAVG